MLRVIVFRLARVDFVLHFVVKMGFVAPVISLGTETVHILLLNRFAQSHHIRTVVITA